MFKGASTTNQHFLISVAPNSMYIVHMIFFKILPLSNMHPHAKKHVAMKEQRCPNDHVQVWRCDVTLWRSSHLCLHTSANQGCLILYYSMFSTCLHYTRNWTNRQEVISQRLKFARKRQWKLCMLVRDVKDLWGFMSQYHNMIMGDTSHKRCNGNTSAALPKGLSLCHMLNYYLFFCSEDSLARLVSVLQWHLTPFSFCAMSHHDWQKVICPFPYCMLHLVARKKKKKGT